jgi:TolB protein
MVWLLLVAACLVGEAAGGAAPSQRIAFSVTEGRATRLYTARPNGTGRQLVSRFRCCGISSENSPAWSRDGSALAFVRSTLRGSDFVFEVHVREIGRPARRVTRPGPGDIDSAPSWSPDGRLIAFTRDNADAYTRSIYVVAPDGSGLRRLTQGAQDDDPAWSPDGRKLAFSRHPRNAFVYWPGRAQLMVVSPDGSNLRGFPRALRGREPAWSPDGRRLAFLSYRDRNGRTCDRDHCYTNAELYVMPADGARLRRLTRTKLDEARPTWSPDGRWIAFERDGRLYRMRAGGGRARFIAKGGSPAWSPR